MAAPNREVEQHTEEPIRLQKFLAAAGIDSRRHAEEYILAGRVSVDGEVVRDLGVRVDPSRQKVHLDGELLKVQPKRYYLLNKPPGYLCTHRDPAGRPRAVDLAPQTPGTRLFTVGRLDESSQGLLLVTNDGELANRLAHPRYRVSRTYRVQVAGKVTRAMLERLKKGLHFPEGKFRVQSIRRVRPKGQSTFMDLELTEGRNREIRRMLARVGHKVIHLERIAFGPLKLGRLPVGRCRPLKPAELKALRGLIEGKPAQRRPSKRKQAHRRPTSKKGPRTSKR